EGVADEVGHALDVLVLEIVGEDDRVALFLEGEDLLLDRRERRERGARRKDDGLVVEERRHGRRRKRLSRRKWTREWGPAGSVPRIAGGLANEVEEGVEIRP